MFKRSYVALPVVLVSLLTIVSRPVSAQCVSRGPGGDCFDGRISTKFIHGLAEKNPLLAGAVWGAVTEVDSATRQTLYSRLVAGEYTGTMGKSGMSYRFRTRVQLLAGEAFSLAVHVEEDGTGRTQEFEGIVLDEGRTGNLMQIGQEGRKSVFSWNAPDREK